MQLLDQLEGAVAAGAGEEREHGLGGGVFLGLRQVLVGDDVVGPVKADGARRQHHVVQQVVDVGAVDQVALVGIFVQQVLVVVKKKDGIIPFKNRCFCVAIGANDDDYELKLPFLFLNIILQGNVKTRTKEIQ